jgi:hypothetical protein
MTGAGMDMAAPGKLPSIGLDRGRVSGLCLNPSHHSAEPADRREIVGIGNASSGGGERKR